MKKDKRTPENESSEETIGGRFVAAREAMGWTVEDAARILRMRPGLVRDLEANNLQNFSHPSYARLSLLDYARLLRVPVDEIRPWLPDPGSPGSGDYQYLEQFADPKPAARREEVLEQSKPARPIFGFIQILVFLAVIGLLAYGYIFFLNLNRITTSGTSPEPVEEPEPTPANIMVGVDESFVESPGLSSPALDAEYLEVNLHVPEGMVEATPAPLTETVTLEIRAALPVEASEGVPSGDAVESDAPADSEPAAILESPEATPAP